MRITIHANSGTYVAYLSTKNEISVYASDEDCPMAILAPRVKRQATLDLTAAGVANEVVNWLDAAVDRLEIESITVQLTSLRRIN